MSDNFSTLERGRSRGKVEYAQKTRIDEKTAEDPGHRRGMRFDSGPGAHYAAGGRTHDPVRVGAGEVPPLGGGAGHPWAAAVCGHGVPPGGRGHHPRGASGNCGRLCLWSGGGNHRLPAGCLAGRSGGLCPGAPLWGSAGGGVLPHGEAAESAVSQKLTGQSHAVFADFYDTGHPQGPAVLLRGSHGHEADGVASHQLPGPDPLRGHFHHRRRRPGERKLPFRRHRICCHIPDQCRGPYDLQPYLQTSRH